MKKELPEQLKELEPLKNWVAWRVDKKGEKLKKVPICPFTGTKASSTNPETWSDFDNAVKYYNYWGPRNNCDGIGFMFGTEPCGYAGIDIDDCISPDGTLSDMAADIVSLMQSYTEISPSGTGLHILFKLDKPLAEIGKGNRNDRIGLEIYDRRRYLTVTGNVYGPAWPIAERTDALRQVYAKYMAKPEREKIHSTTDNIFDQLCAEPEPAQTTTVDNRNRNTTPNGNTENISDSELWERMFNSENGGEIRALYNGDISGYSNDDSRADLALCNHLAWWTHDAGRVDRMFRQSKLMRPKWDERHGAQTYGERTIEKAMENRYVPQEKPGHVNENKNAVKAQTATRKDNQVSTELSTVGVGGVALSSDTRQAQDTNMAECELPMNSYDYIEKQFNKDLENFRKFPIVKTGLDDWDKKQGGFVPGLYVLGATPSLGKTTLMSQVCDNIAQQGESVLFFSLEQTRLEMVTKSLSRLTAIAAKNERDQYAVSAINIRRGYFPIDRQRELVKNAIAEYQKFSSKIVIVEPGFNTTVSTICDTVSRFGAKLPYKPIVIIDYLQILQPDDKINQGGRDATECVIKALKEFQAKNELLMFVISSFNRSNYTNRVDYSSFKETGLIEYSCDGVLGLQPTVLHEKSALFKDNKSVQEQRQEIRDATSAIPRRVVLSCLKNRHGVKNYDCGFKYDPRFDLFEPDKIFKDND